jgi:hypothetical protein
MRVKQPFIEAVISWEMSDTATRNRPHQAVLKHLRSPSVDARPKNYQDAFYSVLFNYLFIDILAHHNGIGKNIASKGRTAVPASTHLVRD